MSYRTRRNLQIDQVFLQVATDISSLSHAVRAKVGAIIVGKDNNIQAYGYNGTPTGFDNQAEIEVEEKLVTKPETLHAESNAIAKIAKSPVSCEGSTLYVTMSPCFECSKLIIQSGIKRVVYEIPYRETSGIDLLKKCNVKVEHIERNGK